jgi:uncharacterized damage-inducible protein DinB
MRGTVSTFPPYQQYATAKLFEAYRAAPGRLRAVLEGLSPEELRARPRTGKWSAIEITCHLVDSEIIAACRVRMALAQPGATFPGYDQDRWTPALAHQERDQRGLETVLGLFESLRRETGLLLDRASPGDWEAAWGVHPDYGAITLRNLLELYADHGERHLQQIMTLRRLLGRPRDVEILLADRLY